jgi:uncharacterized protein
MPAFVHFEIPADDLARAKKFYQSVFGWTMKDWNGPNMTYTMVMTKEKGVGIDGGMMKRENPGQVFTNYIMVDNIDTYLDKLTKAGAKICMPKTEIAPGMGWIALFQDTERNIIGLHQAPAKMKPAKKAAKKAAKKTAAKKKK